MTSKVIGLHFGKEWESCRCFGQELNERQVDFQIRNQCVRNCWHVRLLLRRDTSSSSGASIDTVQAPFFEKGGDSNPDCNRHQVTYYCETRDLDYDGIQKRWQVERQRWHFIRVRNTFMRWSKKSLEICSETQDLFLPNTFSV